jgi:hypothetical protein
MTFWTQPDVSPTRQFRFMVSANEEDWWWVSSCSKPSYELTTEEYKLINHKFKYPGVVTWNDVNLTIVDTNIKTFRLISGLELTGYYPEESFDDGISKRASYNELGTFRIKQLDAEGKTVESWTLKNAFVKSTNFGQLDYASDELVKLELVIAYDYATLNQ